jgi:hypothetical protein
VLTIRACLDLFAARYPLQASALILLTGIGLDSLPVFAWTSGVMLALFTLNALDFAARRKSLPAA